MKLNSLVSFQWPWHSFTVSHCDMEVTKTSATVYYITEITAKHGEVWILGAFVLFGIVLHA